jgi:hypothetical protein
VPEAQRLLSGGRAIFAARLRFLERHSAKSVNCRSAGRGRRVFHGIVIAERLGMRTHLLKTLAILVVILGPVPRAHAQFSFGIRIGEPPPTRASQVPPCPGAGYVWVEGYYFPEDHYVWVEGYQYAEEGHYSWHEGYWTRPPYQGAYWVEPYHANEQYYYGHWEGARGAIAHEHRWDREKQRDEGRDDRHAHGHRR